MYSMYQLNIHQLWKHCSISKQWLGIDNKNIIVETRRIKDVFEHMLEY